MLTFWPRISRYLDPHSWIYIASWARIYSPWSCLKLPNVPRYFLKDCPSATLPILVAPRPSLPCQRTFVYSQIACRMSSTNFLLKKLEIYSQKLSLVHQVSNRGKKRSILWIGPESYHTRAISCDQVARWEFFGTCCFLVFRVCSCIYLFVWLRDFCFQQRKFTIPRGKTFYLIYVWNCFTKTLTDKMSWLHHRSYGWL